VNHGLRGKMGGDHRVDAPAVASCNRPGSSEHLQPRGKRAFLTNRWEKDIRQREKASIIQNCPPRNTARVKIVVQVTEMEIDGRGSAPSLAQTAFGPDEFPNASLNDTP